MTPNQKGSLLSTLLRVVFNSVVFIVLLVSLACGGGSSSSPGVSSGDGGTGSGTSGGGGSGAGGGSGGSGGGVFAAGRTKYVRTDATTEYYQWINLHWIIHNPLTSYFYVSDPSGGQVIVLDAASEATVRRISVPGAFSIDDSPDHKTLYVGSVVGDLYTVDPIQMTVTGRYMAAQIGPSGYFAESAVALADGRLALLGGAGGISLDGVANFALWNPTDNSLTLGSGCNSFVGSIGGFSRTPDRTKVILSSVDGGMLCVIDERTGQGVTSPGLGFPAVNFRVTPDSRYIVVPTNTLTLAPNAYASVYDTVTLELVRQFPVMGDTSTVAGFAISADSKTLFVPNAWVIYAYDLATGNQIGWLSNMDVPVISGGGAWGPISAPNLQAVDGTGLLAGPLEEGVGFIDSTTLRSGSVGSQFANGYVTPATGPVSGNTQVTITEPSSFGTLSAVYFGSHPATKISGVSGPNINGNFGSISATSPSGTPGTADVYAFTADGGTQVMPEGFSYGPSIVEVLPNISTAEGGGIGVIYGYGFGPVSSGVTGPLPQSIGTTVQRSNAIPSDLEVSVGGHAVQVIGFAPYAYPTQSPPFPLQALAYVVPPGNGSADITITTGSGSSTARAVLTYLPPLQQFSSPGSVLVQGTYDRYRDLYYFTDSSKIQVFSRAQTSWLTPISIPAPTGSAQRLWGIALSPDGSKLAVSDAASGTVSVLDPLSPSHIESFNVGSRGGVLVNPAGLAISDSGVIYYTVTVLGQGGGADQFFKLDTTTGAILDYHLDFPGLGPSDGYLRELINSDNTRVFGNADGFVFYIDTATDTVVPASVYPGCCYGDYELTLSGDGTQFMASSNLYDSALNEESYYALNDRAAMNISYVYGAKLSRDGRFLFQPSTSGIDVYDGKLGGLLGRVALPVPLSSNYDALVADGKDNVLVAITGAGDGIALLDLRQLQEPAALPYAHLGYETAQYLTGSHSGSLVQHNGRNGGQASIFRSNHRVPHQTIPVAATMRVPVSHDSHK